MTSSVSGFELYWIDERSPNKAQAKSIKYCMEEWTKILLEVSPTLLEITGKDSVVILVTVQASQLYECWKTVFFFKFREKLHY